MSDNARYSPPSIRFEYISAVGTSLYGTRLQREPPVAASVLKPNARDVPPVVPNFYTNASPRRRSFRALWPGPAEVTLTIQVRTAYFFASRSHPSDRISRPRAYPPARAMAPTFDKLDDTNYAEWRTFMQALLSQFSAPRNLGVM